MRLWYEKCFSVASAVIITALVTGAVVAVKAQNYNDTQLSPIIKTCLILVAPPSGGEICLKPDGSVEFPPGINLDDASLQFWETMARTYRIVKQEKCI